MHITSMANDNKQTYAQKKCLAKGNASCHTSNEAFREGYDRVFRKVNNRDEAIKAMCGNPRADWPGTQYTDVLPECQIYTGTVRFDDEHYGVTAIDAAPLSGDDNFQPHQPPLRFYEDAPAEIEMSVDGRPVYSIDELPPIPTQPVVDLTGFLRGCALPSKNSPLGTILY